MRPGIVRFAWVAVQSPVASGEMQLDPQTQC